MRGLKTKSFSPFFIVITVDFMYAQQGARIVYGSVSLISSIGGDTGKITDKLLLAPPTTILSGALSLKLHLEVNRQR